MVFKAVLQLYMENMDLPLPSLEEVLLCNSSTTSEEVRVIFVCVLYMYVYSCI